MISEEYKKAVDLVRPFFPIDHDLAKVVEVFKFLVEEGCYAGDDDIFQYVIEYGKHREDERIWSVAAEIQRTYEDVKAVLRPDMVHWKKGFLRKELLGE